MPAKRALIRASTEALKVTELAAWTTRQIIALKPLRDDVWPLLFNADLSAKPALEGVAQAFRGESCTSEF